jgi:mono/diheme cytochrome c family protein
MAEHKKGAIAYYLIIALILGAITYLEFAIVEFQDAISWLNPFWTIVTLVALSIVKFAMVVAIYMHLRDDDPIYTGFFSSGIVIAMGTFVALSFLFTVRSVNNFRAQEKVTAAIEGEAQAGHGEATHEVLTEPVKTLAEASHVPAPKNQKILKLALPAAPVAEFSLRLPGLAMAESAPQVTEAVTEASTATTETSPVAEVSAETATTTTTETEPAQVEVAANTETTEAPSEEPVAQAASFDWQKLGDKTFTANCMACHQANGQGIPGAFPPLAGHIPELYNAEGGRKYIINVVLYGLMGEITVKDAKYNSVMTPWAAVLSDEQIAATLNHELNSWGNDALVTDFTPILPEEVAAERDKGLSSSDVLGLRPK